MADIARQLLSVPATSTASERVFFLFVEQFLLSDAAPDCSQIREAGVSEAQWQYNGNWELYSRQFVILVGYMCWKRPDNTLLFHVLCGFIIHYQITITSIAVAGKR